MSTVIKGKNWEFLGLYGIICLILSLLISPAAAYVDPSVMTYAVQAIIGFVIVIGVSIGAIWRRFKKKAKVVLNVDENANKEIEEDIVEIK